MQLYKKAVFLILILLLLTLAPLYADSASDSSQVETGSVAVAQDDDEFDLDDEFEEAEFSSTVSDPLSGYNKFMTSVNDKLYFWILKPVAKGFCFVIPEIGRKSINRFFKNILFPIRFTNNLLQFKVKRACEEIARFGVNTTVGVLGFGDPAHVWFQLEEHNEDFGQTLGHYGVGSGFYFVWPILGPSNARDSVGMIPDYFLNPISYIGNFKIETSLKAFEKFDYTSLHLGEYEEIKKDSINFYSFMRDAYEQNRRMKIKE